MSYTNGGFWPIRLDEKEHKQNQDSGAGFPNEAYCFSSARSRMS